MLLGWLGVGRDVFGLDLALVILEKGSGRTPGLGLTYIGSYCEEIKIIVLYCVYDMKYGMV